MSIAVPNIPEYNSSLPNGGDSLKMDLNAPYVNLEFHMIYQLLMGCLVFLIIPGIGLLYGGMARRKSSLSMIFQSMTVVSLCTIQWMFWGYSIAFSRTGHGHFIGDFSNFALKNTLAAPSWGSAVLPEVVFCFYEMFFCACATMIVVGGSFERGRIVPSLIFAFFWSTLVYCPIAYWTWNPDGWLYNLPGLDFAGGGPVHISSGSAALAYALVLGKRKQYGQKEVYKPHNVTIVFLGTVLIWFGWFGFNGGSALNASLRAMVATFNTQIAASSGVLGWVTVDYFKNGKKFSVVGACEGAIAGLVGITPAAGYVSLWSAAAIGVITAAIVSCFQNVNEWLHIDDGLEVFKLHGIGGMVGGFLTGIFAQSSISALDGASIYSGAIDGNGIQVAKQLGEIAAIASYSFTMSLILLMILKYIPGLHLRVTDEVEILGYDVDQFHQETIGEWALWEVNLPHAQVTEGVKPEESDSPTEGSRTPAAKSTDKTMGTVKELAMP